MALNVGSNIEMDIKFSFSNNHDMSKTVDKDRIQVTRLQYFGVVPQTLQRLVAAVLLYIQKLGAS